MIKQVSLALVALGLSASAYAAHPVEEMLPAAPPTVAGVSARPGFSVARGCR